MEGTMPKILVVAGLLLGGAFQAGCSPAHALETFDLAERDKVLYEAPGCTAECQIMSPTRRVCSVKGYDCKVICQPLADCRPDGGSAMNVCIVVKR
jgi:hypothetical protein